MSSQRTVRFMYVNPPSTPDAAAFRLRMGWPYRARGFSILGLRFGWAWMMGRTFGAWANVVNGWGDAQLDLGRLRLWVMW